jgi:hypothetical protein
MTVVEISMLIKSKNKYICHPDCAWIRKSTLSHDRREFCALFERRLWHEVLQGNQRSSKCVALCRAVANEAPHRVTWREEEDKR